MKWLIEAKDGCVITVKVTPRAAKSEILGAESEWLRVRVKAPPVDGKANKALIEFMADLFSIKKRDIKIESGEKSRIKTLSMKNGNIARIGDIINRTLEG